MGKWCVFLCAKKKKGKQTQYCSLLVFGQTSSKSQRLDVIGDQKMWVCLHQRSLLTYPVWSLLLVLLWWGFFMLLFCVWLESSLLKAILSWLSPILFIYIIFFVAIMCCYKFIWMRVTQALDFPLIHSVVEGFFSLWLNILKLLVAELLGTRSKHIKGWGKKCYLFWEDMKCKFLW